MAEEVILNNFSSPNRINDNPCFNIILEGCVELYKELNEKKSKKIVFKELH
jgi:hypothetical protein